MSTEQFYQLTPDVVLAGLEAAGFPTTGTYIQLNSYENRVFEVHLEKDLARREWGERIIVKYYRPLRWDRRAILDEHFFLEELKSQGIPVIAPLIQQNRETLSSYQGMHLAVFPKALGRIPQELSLMQLQEIGRLLARIHNVGAQRKATSRPTMDTQTYGWTALATVLPGVAPEVRGRYEAAARNILSFLDDSLDQDSFIRIHGDCHKGNLLQKDSREGDRQFFFVDFDDFCNGPPAQDFWMLFSGDEDASAEEEDYIIEGYRELRTFSDSQRRLFLPLRGLRILHYAAWITRRWSDPSFPNLFPDFGTYTYWAEETEALERIAWRL